MSPQKSMGEFITEKQGPAFPLKPGDKIGNAELVKIFQCSTQGGMRRSLRTSTLVVVSNHVTSIYGDRWTGNTLYYTGMGQLGDQTLEGNQNRTLYESRTNGVGVHLFEVLVKGRYTYVGEVELAASPFQEPQSDANGEMRLAWIFPLTLKEGGKLPAVSLSEFRTLQKTHAKKTSEYSDQKLRVLLPKGVPKPSKRLAHSYEYSRSPVVVAAALRRAKGVCQLCDLPAPFLRKDGTPFLEVHHIRSLSDEGEDTLENCVALCPNCHRKVHALNRTEDRQKLLALAQDLGSFGSAV